MNSSLDINAAKEIALAHVRQLALSAGDEFDILPESTVEDTKGWVFFYNSADFVRTRSPMDSLAGNGPILVLRDGSVVDLPSAVPWKDALKDLRRG